MDTVEIELGETETKDIDLKASFPLCENHIILNLKKYPIWKKQNG